MENNDGGPPPTYQACAACKHQRKRCKPDCILAPYFSATKISDFQAVHKQFGVSNIQKLLRSLRTDEERHEAVQSLIWEAKSRQKDPVNGAYGEYKRVCEELNLLKRQQYMNQAQQNGIYRQPAAAGLMGGWNNNINRAGTSRVQGDNSTVNYINSNRNWMLDPSAYNYPSLGIQELEGREPLAPVDFQSLNQQQHYYLTDQLN